MIRPDEARASFIEENRKNITRTVSLPTYPNTTNTAARSSVHKEKEKKEIKRRKFHVESVERDDEKRDMERKQITPGQIGRNDTKHSRSMSVPEMFNALKVWKTGPMKFEWDPKRKNKNLSLSHDLQTFTAVSSQSGLRSLCSICSQNVLSNMSLAIVRWEMTLKQKGNRMYFMMGYLDSRGIGDFADSRGIGYTENERALWVLDGEYPKIHSGGSTIDMHWKWKFNTSIGDRFRLDFDFKKRECSAFYNDEWVGLITTELPPRIYLAASVLCEGTSLATTRFEASC